MAVSPRYQPLILRKSLPWLSEPETSVHMRFHLFFPVLPSTAASISSSRIGDRFFLRSGRVSLCIFLRYKPTRSGASIPGVALFIRHFFILK